MSNETTNKNQAKGINWDTAIFMGLFHLGAVAALFMFSWQAFVAAILLWWITASLGVGMGFHRLLTHRGYKTPKLVEYILSVSGTLAFEGGPINWVVTHRIHHAHTDAPGDPHTPRDGGWWAHMGWILKGTAQQYDSETVARYAPDLVKDRFHVLLNRLYWLPLVVLGIALLALWWLVVSDVGYFLPRHVQLARHLAGQFGHTHVGQTTVRHPGRLEEQLVGRAADLWRRLAQQSSCAPDLGASWTGLVRNRSQLVGYSRYAISATGESGEVGRLAKRAGAGSPRNMAQA